MILKILSKPDSSVKLNTERDHPLEEDAAHWRTNLFTLYARVFRIMLAKWKKTIEDAEEAERTRQLDNLIVPSNQDWRYQVYYRLVDLQREIDLGPVAAETDNTEMKESIIETKDPNKWDWEPGEVVEFPLRPKSGNIDASLASLAAIKESGGSMTEACIEPGWRVGDILLAAEVLQGESPAPTYRDEAEMRRVFGLVYDVLRYKEILNQALQDVGFWYRYSKHRSRERTVWLLLYDMQGRKFSRRGDVAVVELRERALREAGLEDIEKALLETKTRLAASISRLRIGGSALTLEQLLPAHLRTVEGVTWGEDGAIASGWVNTIKISSKAQFVVEMAKLKLRLSVDRGDTELDENQYVFDPLCPKVVNLHDKARERLAMSELVTSYRFVFLERSLCLGAAALARSVRCRRLCGPVVLTHSIAPRHTAYLAGLLADIEDAGRLLAFGTGEQRLQYEQYLTKLGVTVQQCRVFSERYVNPPPLAELERATVVLATPPCSYTGVRDVVDLAVARGGDTTLLESLTNINIELDQPRALLTEQLTTLKYALTRPNVQLLIYQAHSILPSETVEMVQQIVQYANRMAADKYAREHPPKRKLKESKESSTTIARSGKSGKRGQALDHKKDHQEDRRSQDEQEAAAGDIEVPESDLFEIGAPVDLYGRESVKWFNDGCYLAVIKRKEMMQFNSLFMIKVAESKGLFGDPTKQREEQPKEEDQQKQHQDLASPVRQGSHRKSFKRPKIETDRISAPTHSSIVRSRRGKDDKTQKKASCPRHIERVAQDESSSSAQQFRRTSNVSTGETRQLKIQRQENENSTRTSTLTFSKKAHIVKDTTVIEWRNEEAYLSPSIENALQDNKDAPSTWHGKSLFDEETLKSSNFKDYGNSSIFSFGYGSRAINHATQPIFLEDVLDERDNENLWQSGRQQSALALARQTSRLYHPGGSLRFSRVTSSDNCPATSDQHSESFSYSDKTSYQ